MKNLLFTLVLLFSLHSFGQENHNVSNPVSAVFYLLSEEYNSIENAAIVPEGKFWMFPYELSPATDSSWRYNPFSDDAHTVGVQEGNTVVPPGYKVWCYNCNDLSILTVFERNLNTESSLSSTNVELPNQIRLFPNPTTSEVALNSDKQYDIEVYDILGNKVMELTGNTIDMEHLSSATYIVNALDTETNERLSYKVIKH